MLEHIETTERTVGPVDVDWKISHLIRSIRTRERILTGGGFAAPHVPDRPAVVAERTARQLAGIADLRDQLAHWEAIRADRAATTAIALATEETR